MNERSTYIIHITTNVPVYVVQCVASSAQQVFQTFSCEPFPEISKSYLRADPRIECYTATHTDYRTYAAVMIFLCEYIACLLYTSDAADE